MMPEWTGTWQVSMFQLYILGQLANGATIKQISENTYYSYDGIKSQLRTMCKLAGARNKTHLVAMAVRKGVI